MLKEILEAVSYITIIIIIMLYKDINILPLKT